MLERDGLRRAFRLRDRLGVHRLILDRDGKSMPSPKVRDEDVIKLKRQRDEHDERSRKSGRAAHSPQHHEDGCHFGSRDVSDGSFGCCRRLRSAVWRRPGLWHYFCANHPMVRRSFSPEGGGKGGGSGGNCFLKGTKILTAEGECRIEDLAIGDLLPTMLGWPRPVQWIGRYSIKKSDPSKGWVKDVLPVRIARSALAPDVPHADLYVTSHHNLLIDGVLVPAEMLINGTTITRYEAGEYEEMEFFHVKLESHGVIYAEGVPAETLMNVDEVIRQFCRLPSPIWNARDRGSSLRPDRPDRRT